MAEIFISYRQADSKGWAIAVRDSLAAAFGAQHVFLDKETLKAGKWRDQIRSELSQARIVVIVIGPRWLEITDEKGRPRISSDGDVHREEIADSLSRQNVTVIPLLVDEARMPGADELPSDIKDLLERQARRIGDTEAHRKVDLAILADDIQAASGLRRRTIETGTLSVTSPGSAARVTLIRTASPLLVASIIAIVAYYFGSPLNLSEFLFVLAAAAVVMLAARWSARALRSKRSSR